MTTGSLLRANAFPKLLPGFVAQVCGHALINTRWRCAPGLKISRFLLVESTNAVLPLSNPQPGLRH